MKSRFSFLNVVLVALVSLSLTNSLLPSRLERIVDAAYSGRMTFVCDASLDELNRALAIAEARSLSNSSYQRAVDCLEDRISELKRREGQAPTFLQTVGHVLLGTALLGLVTLGIIYGPPPAPRYHVKTIRVYEPYYRYYLV